jgi:hypothetical protein
VGHKAKKVGLADEAERHHRLPGTRDAERVVGDPDAHVTDAVRRLADHKETATQMVPFGREFKYRQNREKR